MLLRTTPDSRRRLIPTIMILEILVVWMALGLLAALFNYCCSRVSEGGDQERAAHEPAPDPLPGSHASGESRQTTTAPARGWIRFAHDSRRRWELLPPL